MNNSTYPITRRDSSLTGQDHDLTLKTKLDMAIRMYDARQLDEAQQQCMEILAKDVHSAECLNLLGLVLYNKGHLETAAKMVHRALAIKKNYGYHFNLGLIHEAQHQYDDAISEYRKAERLKTNFVDANYNLGSILARMGRIDEAVTYLKRTIVLDPSFAKAHCNLGGILQRQRKYEAAIAHLDKALAFDPNLADAHNNKGLALQALGEYQRSLVSYDKALAINPQFADAQFNRAMLLLLHANYSYGWIGYEARWQLNIYNTKKRNYVQPLWNGEELENGRLYLWGEQGVGDEIMFAGLIPDLMLTKSDVVLECDARLQPLFARSFPEIDVVARETQHLEQLHSCPAQDVIAHLPTGSLAPLLRADDAAFAKTTSPYLKADPGICETFRARYGRKKMLVGLAWHSKNKDTGFQRSIDLSHFAPLFNQPNIDWISLQYGDHDELRYQAAEAALPLHIDRSVDQFVDIDRFAAQVSALDLVITIDNSTAHLAAALGSPVWLLLPAVPEWRWLLERSDCPWYPTMRLFRQSTASDWSTVIARVAEELTALQWAH